MDALKERAEETEFILKYFTNIGLSNDKFERLVDLFISGSIIYDYQLYQILKWCYEINYVQQQIVDFCRKIIQDFNRDPWLRSYAFAYVTNFGGFSDWEIIETLYASLSEEIERCDCISALKNQEIGRRNAFYKAVEKESFMIHCTIRWIKSLK